MRKNYFLFLLAFFASATLFNAQQTTISFEAEEGYELGDINQQQGWTTTTIGQGVFTDLQIISDERAKTGARSLRIINDPNIMAQPFPVMGAFYLLDNPLDKSNFTLSYSISIDSFPGGNSSIFALECGSNIDEKLVLEIYFSYDGIIKILENNDLDFTETVVGNWERNTWYDVQIVGNEDVVEYYLNGDLVHTGALLYNIDEIRFAHDNYAGAAFIDDVNISYETLAVKDITLNSWSIYPNPVKDVINVQGLDNVKSLVIFDAVGKKVGQYNNVSNQINVSNLNKGVYVLQINTDKGKISKKFIKN